MSDVKVNISVNDGGSTIKLTKSAINLKEQYEGVVSAAGRISKAVIAAQQGVAASNAMAVRAPISKLDSSRDSSTARSLGAGTGAEARDFAKQAQGLGGLVHVYATFAANIFAVSAAFSALSKAADTTNMVKGLDQLGASSGRNLGSLAKQLTAVTDNAISFRDAMTATAQASAGGMTNAAILRMGNVAKQASQALGVAMPDAMSRLSRGITKLEPELLDEIGIMVRVDTASSEYARTLGKATSALTDFEKRQGFANAVLEQGERKFGAIQIDANPYAKILASMENIAQKGLELVNTVLGPLVSMLAASPTGLSVALAAVASVLLKQAIPALGQHRQNMKQLAEDSHKNVLRIYDDQQELQRSADMAAADAGEKAFRNAASTQKRILELTSGTGTGRTAKILQKNPLDISEEDMQVAMDKRDRLLASEKSSYNLRGKALESHLAKVTQIRGEYRDAGEDAAEAYIAKDTGRFDHQVQLTKILDQANEKASKRKILALAAEAAAVLGPTKAYALLNAEIAASNMGRFAKSITLVTGTLGIMTTAVTTAVSALSRVFFVIGIITTAVAILDSIFSTASKESSRFEDALSALNSSLENVNRTIDVVNKKDPTEYFSVESIQAKANAFNELTEALNTQATAFEKLTVKQSGWEKFWDGAWDMVGRGSIDKLADTLGDTVVASIALLEEGPAKKSAKEALASILGQDVDLTSSTAISNAIESLTKPEAISKAKELSKALSQVSREVNNSAESLTSFKASILDVSKQVEVMNNLLKPTDATGKLGASLIASSYQLGIALADPIKKATALNEIVKNTNFLNILPVSVVERIKEVSKELNKLNTDLAVAQKEAATTEAARLKAINNLGLGGTAAGQLVQKAAVEAAAVAATNLKNASKALQTANVDLKGLDKVLFTTGIAELSKSLSTAMAEGGKLAAQGYLSVIKEAGGATAELDAKLQTQSIQVQIKVIESQFSLRKAIMLQTAVSESNTIAIQLATAESKLSAGVDREATTAERAKLITAQEVATKKIATLLGTDKAAISTFKTDMSETGIEAGKQLSGYIEELFGKQGQLAKLFGALEASVLQEKSGALKDTAAIAKRGIEAGISTVTTDLSAVQNQQTLVGLYDRELQSKKDILELKLQDLEFSKKVVDSELKVNIAKLVLNKGNTATQLKALETLKAAETDLANLRTNNTKSVAALKLKELSESLRGEETLRVLESNRAAQVLADTQAIASAKLQQQENEIQYLNTIGALDAQTTTRRLADIALQQQSLAYEKESAELKSSMEAKVAALSGTLTTQIAAGVDTTKTVADIQIMTAQYALQKSTIDLANQSRVTSITLTAEHKAMLEGQTEQMEKMVSVTQSLASVFGDLGASIGKAGEAILKMGQDDESYSKAKIKLQAKINDQETDPKDRQDALSDLAKLDKKASKDQLSNIANIAGATKGMFKEHTFAAKALGAVEKGFHIAKLAMMAAEVVANIATVGPTIAANMAKASSSGIAAIMAAFAAPFPVGFVAGAAMIAIVASILGGGGSKGTTVDMAGLSSADKQETQGTGQAWVKGIKTDTGGGVFGDSSEKSTAIVDSLDIMRENSIEGLDYDNKMLKALEKLANSVEGAAKSLYSVPGLRQGTNFGTMEGAISTKSSLSKLDPLMGSILGGGKSISTSIQSAGIQFKGTFANIMDDVAGSILQYKDILTNTTKKGGWFSSDKSWASLDRERKELSASVTKSLSDIFKDANVLFQELGTKIGISEASITNTLRSFNASMDIDIKGLTGQDLIDELNGVVGSMLSTVANQLFTGFDSFREFGEDYVTTVIRVVDANNKLDQSLRSIGSSFSVVSRFDISEVMIKNAGGLSTFMEQAEFFKDSFLTSAEQLAPVQKSVNAELSRLGISTAITRDQFKSLVLAQNLSSESGQSMYQSLMELAPGFDTVTKAIAEASDSLYTLTIELLTAEGKASEVLRLTRAKELSTLTEAEILLKQRIYLLKDEATKMALEQKIYSALGNAAAALAISREAELRTITDILKPAQQYLYALEDMATLKAKLTTAYNSESTAIKGTITSLTASIKTLKDYKDALTIGASSILTPGEKYAQSKVTALETAALASSTGTSASEIEARNTAISKLPSAAEAFLVASKEMYASSTQYTQDFNTVLDILSSTSASLDNQKTTAELQLSALDTSVSFLDAISKSVDTVATLLPQYLIAQNALFTSQQVAIQAGSGAAASTLLSIPAFASGGLASGTVLVGEKGPELVNFTNPGRVYSNKASNDMLNNKELIAEIKALRNEVNQLRQEQKEQTGHLISTNYDASNKNAKSIVNATEDAVKDTAWAKRSALKVA